MTISDNSVASFHYTLTDSSGQVLDSSEGKEPLSYLHGAGNIIPGLEKHLAGKTVGDKLSVSVPPAEADRKSTRLNSSHVATSYAVFCLKKKIGTAGGPPTRAH